MLNVHDLSRKLVAAFGDDDTTRLKVTVLCFGFKYGIPVDADLVFDARFLPNPFWVPELRPQDRSRQRRQCLRAPSQEGARFADSDRDAVRGRRGYLNEGKRFMSVAIGCTGGKHRSVAMPRSSQAGCARPGTT